MDCDIVTHNAVTYIKDKTDSIQEDWDTFAEKIGLSPKQVGAIRSNVRLASAEQMRCKVIDIWFEMSLPLETLVCGLKSMEYLRKADKIAQKYCGGRMSTEVCKVYVHKTDEL